MGGSGGRGALQRGGAAWLGIGVCPFIREPAPVKRGVIVIHVVAQNDESGRSLLRALLPQPRCRRPPPSHWVAAERSSPVGSYIVDVMTA